MSGPKRIQLRRTKGWRKPEGAIVVARPSKWGNPWCVVFDGAHRWITNAPDPVNHKVQYPTPLERAELVERFAIDVGVFGPHELGADELAELRGHDLACWCPLDQPCHADVLLELANQ